MEDADVDNNNRSKQQHQKQITSKLFGVSFSVNKDNNDQEDDKEEEEPTTRMFFPLYDVSETTSFSSPASDDYPKAAHWVGVKFCHSDPPPLTASEEDILDNHHLQPLKKSRRGPRSRSSQYRGVTFYRRTGRWESHIWSLKLISSFSSLVQP